MGIWVYLGIAGISLCIGMSLLLGFEWLSYPWRRPIWKTTYRPSPAGIKHLDTLIRRLGEVNSWFGPLTSPITHGLQRGLWEQINYLKIEQDALTIIFSQEKEEAIWVLRRLSANQTKKVQNAIFAISEHHSASKEIRLFAKTILRDSNYQPPSKPKIRAVSQHSSQETTTRKSVDKSPGIYSKNAENHDKDGPMANKDGDTYHIYNVGQAGTVGPNSEAHHFQMSQSSGNSYEEMNLEALGMTCFSFCVQPE